MSRMTVFHHASNDAGHVMAVISETDCHVFYGLGFVEDSEHVEPYAPPVDTDALNEQIAQLKQQLAGVPDLQQENAQLTQQLTECQGEITHLTQLLAQTQAQLSEVLAKSDAPPTDSDGATKDQKKNSKA